MQSRNQLPTTIWPFIMYFLKQQRWLFWLFTICCLSPTVDAFLWPYLTGSIVDAIKDYSHTSGNLWSMVGHLLITGLLLWLLIEAMFRGIGLCLMFIIPRLNASIRLSMFRRSLDHSHGYFTNHLSGSISNRVNDMTLMVERIIDDAFVNIMPSIFTAVVFVIYFSTLYWAISLFVSIWVVTHCLLVFYGAQRAEELSETHSGSRTLLIGKIVDVFNNIVAVRSFARNNYEMSDIRTLQKDEMAKRFNLLKSIEINKLLQGINCFVLLGLCLGSSQYIAFRDGHITLGELIISIQGTGGLLMAIWYMGSVIPQLFTNIGICNQALELVNTPIEILDADDATDLVVKDGAITFTNVEFSYHNREPLFSNFNLTIEPRQKVGLVGYSGSGKTTLANLIMRYYDINNGSIEIDGQRIADVTQHSLREQIAIIPQEAALFHRSIMDNIRYGKITASDQEVIAAAKKAQCHDFIMATPEGYHSIIGERGAKLSGGQRQRIAIARAILKDAPIIILDEATSALDSSTEREIHDAINEATLNKTTIIIAHRLSTLSAVDRILVFHKGTLVEDGSHQELIQKQGLYKQLWEMQNNGFLPEKE